MNKFHKGCFGTLLLRLVIGGVFIYHGITKILMPMAGLMDFVGGAATGMGMNFFSNETWFWIVSVCEIVGGSMIILGLCTRPASVVLAIIMLFAIKTRGWSIKSSEFEYVLLGALISLLFMGSKRYSLDHLLCCSRHKDGDHEKHHHD